MTWLQRCDWLRVPSRNVTRFHASLVSWPDEHTKHLSLFSPATGVPFSHSIFFYNDWSAFFSLDIFLQRLECLFLTRYFSTTTGVPFSHSIFFYNDWSAFSHSIFFYNDWSAFFSLDIFLHRLECLFLTRYFSTMTVVPFLTRYFSTTSAFSHSIFFYSKCLFLTR